MRQTEILKAILNSLFCPAPRILQILPKPVSNASYSLLITACHHYLSLLPLNQLTANLTLYQVISEFSLSCPSYITSVPTFPPPWSPQRVLIIRSLAFTSITSLTEHRLLYRYISCMYLRPAHRIFS